MLRSKGGKEWEDGIDNNGVKIYVRGDVKALKSIM